MGKAIGYKLPKIELRSGVVITSATLRHTITFTYKHIDGGALAIGWPEELSEDMTRLANNTRSLRKRFLGYRFDFNMRFTDRFLTAGASAYEQEWFEDRVNYLSMWKQSYPNGAIYVYPFQDRTDIYYNCHLTGFNKTPVVLDDGIKTIGHDYEISLQAIDLTQTRPEPSSRPWTTPTP